jgi:enamine deaminase RidA (YjgF/YER057c/UK114 family)
MSRQDIFPDHPAGIISIIVNRLPEFNGRIKNAFIDFRARKGYFCLSLKESKRREMEMSVEKKLKDMGILLPEASKPVANYVPAVKAGNLLFVSGHGPYNDGKTVLSGKLGKELSIEEGYKTARNVALNCLASTKATLGDLDKVKRVVKLLGMVNCTEDFKDQPKVINGASDLLVEIFGDKGKHARSAVGMQSLPNNIPVEIEMILEVA